MTTVALAGVGYWGSKLLRNLLTILSPDEIVVVDQHLDRVAEVCARFPGVTPYISLDAALAEARPDAVVIATPVETHAELAARALESGCHVLVEKPLTMSTDEAVGLAKLAEAEDRVLMVGHTFLFSPRVEWIASRLAEGGIGQIHYVTSSRLNLGQVRSDANVIWDLAPHDFSIIFHLLGESPTMVETVARSVVDPRLPDVAFIDLTFPSGVIAAVQVSWLAPRKVRNMMLVGDSHMLVYDDSDGDEPVKVYDKGVAVEESAEFGANQLTYRYGDTIAPHIPFHEPLDAELTHFLHCVRSGEKPRSDAWFGVEVVAALEAADRSWREGGTPTPVSKDAAVSQALR